MLMDSSACSKTTNGGKPKLAEEHGLEAEASRKGDEGRATASGQPRGRDARERGCPQRGGGHGCSRMAQSPYHRHVHAVRVGIAAPHGEP
jgi:hypothetical protein